ncbi:MAG TPA: hypothetical protein VE782_16780 [Myxococcaceae bacterium]|nr:hypothetical protein [Myxococcaceae bacterium]
MCGIPLVQLSPLEWVSSLSLLIAGNNVLPEDVEDAVSTVPGISPGRVVAFSVEDEALGTEIVCVVAETEEEEERGRRALRMAVIRAGMQVDVTISRVYLVPPRWMIIPRNGAPSLFHRTWRTCGC